MLLLTIGKRLRKPRRAFSIVFPSIVRTYPALHAPQWFDVLASINYRGQISVRTLPLPHWTNKSETKTIHSETVAVKNRNDRNGCVRGYELQSCMGACVRVRE